MTSRAFDLLRACGVALLLAPALTACDADSLPSAPRPARLTAPGGRDAAPVAPPSTPASPARFEAGQAGGDALPEPIARALQTDERVLDCGEGVRDGVSRFRPDWVAAHRVDLDGDARPDWVVGGVHPCLREAENAFWWVYAGTADGARALMRGERATALEVMRTRTRGFHDLQLHAVSGRGQPLVSTLRYDGEAYVTGSP